MKLRLVLVNDQICLYCLDGSVINATDEVLMRLLTEFDAPAKFKGNDGRWDIVSCDIENARGTTLAVVDDSLNLVVYNKKTFVSLAKPEKYLSSSEYAELHNKSHPLIKRLCQEGRIPGAQKNRSGWLIPQDAPYPERKKREVKIK